MFTTLKQGFRNWAFRRAVESGTLVLNQRRIYIIPSRQGFGFAFVLALMLLGDINYNLSLGYVLTFLLATTAGMTMLHAFRNMAQLEIRAGHVDPVFAGEQARFVFHFNNPGTLPRYQLHLHDDDGRHTVFDLDAQRSTPIELAIPSTQRGWLDSGRLTLYTHYPLGLFHAWTYIHFDVRCLVYPRPAAPQPLPAASVRDGTGKYLAAGDEDFSGLRNYVAGDAMPRIAWKALAREQGLQVKQFSAQQGQELWLDWSLLPNIAQEMKLQLLTRWVLDADAQGLLYGLRLPDSEIAPQHNAGHRAECLRRLALYGLVET
ncbi:DUF58 domain-containing protein [Sideroxydans lithotrophicus]|uniref:Uncharacterized protein n=1 Tax=Sideroxydans lithotrophicus (strain ES-1) TaxID=580332 RepID=D5CUR3_SIDLE|nr:DUF58 domain-containing protein [Sideroxydans lithotrophicus]ADE12450.1 protein of unknown function DUF58 [Sideroxydans lithotrophicus ES-1]